MELACTSVAVMKIPTLPRAGLQFLLVLCVVTNIALLLLQGREFMYQDRHSKEARSSTIQMRTPLRSGYTDMTYSWLYPSRLNESWKDKVGTETWAMFYALERFDKRCQNHTIQNSFWIDENNSRAMCPCVPSGLRKLSRYSPLIHTHLPCSLIKERCIHVHNTSGVTLHIMP